MTKDEFKKLLNTHGQIELSYLDRDYGIENFTGECWFYELYSDECFTFKNHDELLNHVVDGKKIIDICEFFYVTHYS